MKEPTLGKQEWAGGLNMEIEPMPKRTYVKNVVQNVDGTISRLPILLSSNKEGWWLTDGSIYWQPTHTLEGDSYKKAMDKVAEDTVKQMENDHFGEGDNNQ